MTTARDQARREPGTARPRPTSMIAMMNRLWVPAGVVGVTVMVLGGCGGDQQASAQSPAPSQPPAPPASPGTPDSTSPATGAPPGSSRARPITLRGTIRPGVENRCVLLTSGQDTYVLLSAPSAASPALAPGQQVEVVGRIDDATITTCQQGRPLHVSSARVVPGPP